MVLRKGLLISTAVIGIAGVAITANAENAGTSEIETVTVTATKTSERQIDVPVPVAVVSADSLTQTNSVHLEDYAAKIPGISVTSQGNGRSSAIIRGISTGLSNNPTVGITIDDVPIGSSTSAGLGDSIIPDLDPSVLENVEVLRGPQGSLYGANSMGGLIRYVTTTPNLENISGQLSVSGSAVAHGGEGYGVRGSVNLPVITDTLAVQASAFYRLDPGYVDNIRDGEKNANVTRTSGARLAALWQITPDVSYELSAIIQSRKTDGATRVDVSFDRKPLDGNYYSLDRLPGTGEGELNLGIYSGTLKANLGVADLTAITAFSRSAFNGPQDVSASFDKYLSLVYSGDVSNVSTGITNFDKTNKFSQEIRLASKPGTQLEWMFGLFYTHEDSVGDQTVYAADKDTGALYSSDYLYTVHDPASYNEAAMFGSLTYHFTKDFDLQLGGRLSAQHQKFTDVLGGLLEGGTDITKTASSANVFTYSITPRYHLSEDMMVYARVATGYRPGGGNSAPDEPTSYGPDRTVNYEIGFKGVLLPHLLTVDASLFDIEWNNIQLEATSPTNFSFVENGGAARSRGAEISAYLTPLDGMTIAANFSYVDAVLTRNVDVSSLYGTKGDRLPYSSKTAGSLSVDQDFPLTVDLDGFVGATFNYIGSRYAAFPTSSAYSRFFMPAYGTVDLRAGVEYQDWKISLYAKNVFDQVGFTYGQSRNVATRSGNYDASIIAPRTVGLSVTKNF